MLILLERRLDRWPDGSPRTGYPTGAVIGTGMVLWGIERALDQRLWLAYPGNLGSALVQVAGVALVVGGVVVLVAGPAPLAGLARPGAPGGQETRRSSGPSARRAGAAPADVGARPAGRRPGAPTARPGRGRPTAQELGLSPAAAAARYSSSLAMRPIGSWPTVPSRRAAISSGVQRPVA